MNKKEENEHQQEGKIIFLVNSNKWDENKCFNRKLQEMKPTCRFMTNIICLEMAENHPILIQHFGI